MKTWRVTVPIIVTDATFDVVAETEEEAIAYALSEDGFTNDDFQWQEDAYGATAECIDEDDEEEGSPASKATAVNVDAVPGRPK